MASVSTSLEGPPGESIAAARLLLIMNEARRGEASMWALNDELLNMVMDWVRSESDDHEHAVKRALGMGLLAYATVSNQDLAEALVLAGLYSIAVNRVPKLWDAFSASSACQQDALGLVTSGLPSFHAIDKDLLLYLELYHTVLLFELSEPFAGDHRHLLISSKTHEVLASIATGTYRPILQDCAINALANQIGNYPSVGGPAVLNGSVLKILRSPFSSYAEPALAQFLLALLKTAEDGVTGAWARLSGIPLVVRSVAETAVKLLHSVHITARSRSALFLSSAQPDPVFYDAFMSAGVPVALTRAVKTFLLPGADYKPYWGMQRSLAALAELSRVWVHKSALELLHHADQVRLMRRMSTGRSQDVLSLGSADPMVARNAPWVDFAKVFPVKNMLFELLLAELERQREQTLLSFFAMPAPPATLLGTTETLVSIIAAYRNGGPLSLMLSNFEVALNLYELLHSIVLTYEGASLLINDSPESIDWMRLLVNGLSTPSMRVRFSALRAISALVCPPLAEKSPKTTSFIPAVSVTVFTSQLNALARHRALVVTARRLLRQCNGLQLLLNLLLSTDLIGSSIELETLRHFVCRALVGLCGDDTVRQILIQLNVVERLSALSRRPYPSTPAERSAHEQFRDCAMVLISTLAGLRGRLAAAAVTEAADPAATSIARSVVVDATRIEYDDKQLLSLVLAHLRGRGLVHSADALALEAGLDEPAKDPAKRRKRLADVTTQLRRPKSTSDLAKRRTDLHSTSVDTKRARIQPASPLALQEAQSAESPLKGPWKLRSPLPALGSKRLLEPKTLFLDPEPQPSTNVSLDGIVQHYLRDQHRACPHPIAVLPPFALDRVHNCPEHRSARSVSILGGALIPRLRHGRALGANGLAAMRNFQYSRLRNLRNLDEDVAVATSGVFLDSHRLVLSSSHNSVLHLFDTFSLQTEAFTLSSDEKMPPTRMDAHPINKDILALGYAEYESEIAMFDWETKRVQTRRILAGVHSARFSSGGEWVVGTGEGNCAIVFDAETGTALTRLEKETDIASHLFFESPAQFHPNDRLLLNDGILWDWRSSPTRPVHMFDTFGGEQMNTDSDIHPDGHLAIVGRQVWDLRTMKLHHDFIEEEHPRRYAFSGTGSAIFSLMGSGSSSESLLSMIDTVTFTPLGSLSGTASHAGGLVVDPLDHHLVVLSRSRYTPCRMYSVFRREDLGDPATDDDSSEEESQSSASDESIDEDDEEGEDVTSEAMAALLDMMESEEDEEEED